MWSVTTAQKNEDPVRSVTSSILNPRSLEIQCLATYEEFWEAEASTNIMNWSCSQHKCTKANSISFFSVSTPVSNVPHMMISCMVH